MKHILCILVIVIVLLGGPGCKPDVEQAVAPAHNPEPRWVLIRERGGIEEWEVDVADWQHGRDAFMLIHIQIDVPYMLPFVWQGEDTIEYIHTTYGESDDWIVNDKVVLSEGQTVPHDVNSIDRVIASSEYPGRYPNLIAVGGAYTAHMLPYGWHYFSLSELRVVPKELDLYVYYQGLTNFELWKLSRLPNLRGLIIIPLLYKESLKMPRGFPNLNRLLILGSGRNPCWDNLMDYKKLRELRIRYAAIRDKDLVFIAMLENLRCLELSNAYITDDGLVYIASMKGLRELYLDGNQITDIGILRLKGLSGLRKLGIGSTNVTQEGIDSLKVFLPNCRVGSMDELNGAEPMPEGVMAR